MYPTTDVKLLISILNTKLRDQYSSLEDLCEDLDYSMDEVLEQCKKEHFIYSNKVHQFVKEDSYE